MVRVSTVAPAVAAARPGEEVGPLGAGLADHIRPYLFAARVNDENVQMAATRPTGFANQPPPLAG